MRTRLGIIAGVVAGIAFLFLGISDLRDASGDVECNGEAMIPGDECMVLGEGVRSTEEQREALRSSGRMDLVWAAACFAAAGSIFVLDRRGVPRRPSGAGEDQGGSGVPGGPAAEQAAGLSPPQAPPAG